ncbi:unnamed protein product [Urochloa humidicola]
MAHLDTSQFIAVQRHSQKPSAVHWPDQIVCKLFCRGSRSNYCCCYKLLGITFRGLRHYSFSWCCRWGHCLPALVREDPVGSCSLCLQSASIVHASDWCS